MSRTEAWWQGKNLPSEQLGGSTLASPHYYEIRVAGTLPPEALLDFEQLNASVEPVKTMVHGIIPDQAALYGLLIRLESLGAQVLEVRRLYDREPSWDEVPGHEPIGDETPGPG